MPPETTTRGPEGRHRVESLDPPETARQLGLTGAQQAAARATSPEPAAPVPPPVFRDSPRRRAAAATATSGPESLEAPADGGRPAGAPRGSDETTSTRTRDSSPGSGDDELAGDGEGSSWRDRWRIGGRQGRPAGAEPVALRDMPQLRDGIAQAVHAVGDELNDRVAPGTDLFLTDPADEQGLAEPVSRLILRRMPADLAAASNPDFADVIAAGIVLARYAVKQLNVMRALRRQARAAAESGQVPYGTPPAEQPADERLSA